jgi:Mg-chelatase subunit ChlD
LRHKLWSGLIMMICLALMIGFSAPGVSPVRAQQNTGETEAEQDEASTGVTGQDSPFDNLAVVLLIDVSGSMEDTDPLRLRETAAGMFIDLLGEDDYLGVVIFDERAEVAIPLNPVGSPASKEALMGQLAAKLDPRGDTDFTAALELAGKQFSEAAIGGRVPVILMLTDGEPDPFPGSLEDEAFMEEYMESLWEQVDLLAREGILVYTVGFSDEIDPEVIRRIAIETRGKYFILREPGELLLAFYQALESLKDRRSFLEETVDLSSEAAYTLSFEVEEYTRQANLVLVDSVLSADSDLTVLVKPPRGTTDNVAELSVVARDNYVTVILSRPQESHYGRWEVELSGSGEILALGNADLYLEALLMEPDPSANHPLDEPLDIRVEVITRERYTDETFELQMQVTGPDDPGPIEVPMSRDENSFRGLYEYVDRPGEYQLSWQVMRDGKEFLSNAAVISVRRLPAIATDFWVGREGFRLGDQIVVSASLNSSGERIQEGPSLQVDSYSLQLEYRDGARVELELFDSGSAEHGNSRAGDGIWSNILVLDRVGATEALLTASGIYRDADFVLKKRFGFNVSEPGRLSLLLLTQDLWSLPGGILTIPLEITSESPFSQTLRIESDTRRVELLQDRVVIPPGEVMPVKLQMEISDQMTVGSQLFTLSFETEDGMTVVQPQKLDIEFAVLTRTEAFWKRFSGYSLGVGIAAAAGLLLVIIFFGGGSLLNRFYLKPRLMLKGYLHYREEKSDPYTGKGQAGKLKLEELNKKQAVLSFNAENPRADYIVRSGDLDYEMIISNSWNDQTPGFWRGWKALFKRALAVDTNIRCTPPGVLVVQGKAYNRKELHDGDEFESGGFSFKYRVGTEDTPISGKGVNILDGKL